MAGSKPKRSSFYADLDHLRTHFDALDTERCGFIGYAQLQTLAQQIQGFDESMVSELMEKLDRDRDGKVKFEDFEALFAVERESATFHAHPTLSQPATDTGTSDWSLAYNTALESLPAETPGSPTGASAQNNGQTSEGGRELESAVTSQTETPTVVLRHKRVGRRTTSTPVSEGGQGKRGIAMVTRGGAVLSPIHGNSESGRRPLSGDFPDLATQMRHVTGGESSQVSRRSSRVLSWISESEDVLLEDTGSKHPGTLSPTTSPYKSSDEASHVKAILESVCQTQEVGREAIGRLCSHVRADPQEEQELLSLLDHLDKERRGWVKLDDFVRGLQSIKNAALVSPSPPPKPPGRGRFGDEPIPVLSESFTTPVSSNPVSDPTPSSPLPPAARADAEETAFLSVLDPDSSGYINVDSVMTQWLRMGVETPDNRSLQDALSELVLMDASGRMSVPELTASLEGAILAEEGTPTVLRQAALISFKTEISNLRSQVHQVSLERDQLRSSFSRTVEENKRIIREGDEHVDLVTKQSETRIKEEQTRHSERIKEVERSRLEEAKLLEEQAVRQIRKLEDQVQTLKSVEEKLREDLKYSQEDVTDMTNRLSQAHKEISQKERKISLLQRDLSVRADLGYSDDIDGHLSRISELEEEVSERTTQNAELIDRTRGLQDRVDLLTAENEEWRQKYMSQKRRMQRRRSSGSFKHPDHKQRRRRRHSSDESRPQRPKSAGTKRSSTPGVHLAARPVSAVIRRTHPLYEDEEEASESEDDVFEPISPVSLEGFEPLEVQEVEVEYEEGVEAVDGEEEEEEEEEEGGRTPESESSSTEGFGAKSNASLLDEFRNEAQLSQFATAIEQMKREKAELEANCTRVEQQLSNLQEDNRTRHEELQRELERKRRQQMDLEKHLESLEKQRKKLSVTRVEIDAQLADAMNSIAQQVEEIHDLKSQLSPGSEPPSSGELTESDDEESLKEKIQELQEEITRSDQYSQKLEGERSRLLLEAQSLQRSLEAEQVAHQRNLDEIRQQMETIKEEGRERDAASRESLSAAREELKGADVQLDEYQRRARDLETELEKAVSALSSTEEMLVAERKRVEELSEPAVTVSQEGADNEELTVLKTMMEQIQGDYTQSLEANERLKKELQTTKSILSACQHVSEKEISKLQTQLINAHKEISDQSSLYEEEIAQLKDEFRRETGKQKQISDVKLSEVRADFERQTASARRRHDIQLQVVRQDLKSSELKERGLLEKLSLVEVQCENAFNELAELRAKSASWEAQVAELEEREDQTKQEISRLESNAQNHQEEMAQLRDGIQSYKQQIQRLTEELQSKALSPAQAVIAVEEMDFLEPRSSSPRPLSRSSFYSEQSAHEELLTQMKSQLEELQKVLALQGKGSRENGSEIELSLVQELLSSNATLQSELQKLQKNLDYDQLENDRALHLKEEELKVSQTDKKAAKSVLTEATNKLIGEMLTLAERTRRFLSMYSPKLQSAAAAVTSVRETLSDRDCRQTGAIDSLLEDLDQSRELSESYRTEAAQLKLRLGETQSDLNRSHSEASELRQASESELERMKQKLEETQRERDALADELHSKLASAVPEHLDSPDTDEETAPLTLPRPRSQSSYYSDGSAHDGLLTQMKSQLEELQKALVLQRKDSSANATDPELSLVQELLANSASLQEQTQKEHKSFEVERLQSRSAISAKDEEVRLLKLKASHQKEATEAVITAASAKLLESMSMLVERSRAFLSTYEAKVQSAVSTLALIRATLCDRDSRQTSAMDSLLDELDQSRVVVENCRGELDKLRADVETAQENLNQSQDEMWELQRTKEVGVEELRAELEKVRRELEASSSREEARHPIVQPQRDEPQEAGYDLQPEDVSLLSLSKDQEIQALRQELEETQALERQAQEAHHVTVAELAEVKSQLREAEAHQTALQSRLRELEARERSPKAQPKRSAASAQADYEDDDDEILKRDEIIQQKEDELARVRMHLERAKSEAKNAFESQEQAIKERDLELKSRERELLARDERIRELDQKLQSVVTEPIEAVVQYMELQPLESVNEAMLAELQREADEEKSRVQDLESEYSEEVQQLRDDLNRSLTDSQYHTEQVSSLEKDLQEAKDELREALEEKAALESEYEQKMQDMREKHSAELSAARHVADDQTKELRGLYDYLVSLRERQRDAEGRRHFEHPALLQEVRKEIDGFKAQLSAERLHVLEMEESVSRRMEEHDAMEEELHTEHEEEVRALHQQKDQLGHQLESLQNQYCEVLSEQERQNSAILQELLATKAQLETELRQKSEELYRAYQRMADMSEEKKVLMDLVQQLAFQSAKPIQF